MDLDEVSRVALFVAPVISPANEDKAETALLGLPRLRVLGDAACREEVLQLLFTAATIGKRIILSGNVVI